MKIVDFNKPLIIAHRGYKKNFPENTMEAFDAAIENGARMIELDVTLTKDRKIAVIHDETLDRTTNSTGLVSDYTIEELKKLDAGSWFSKDFSNSRIPVLDEIFESYSHKTMINIEIKPEAYEEGNPTDSIENKIIELIQKYNCLHSVIISSFEKKIIERINRLQTKPLISFLSEEPLNTSALNFMKNNNVFSWNPDYSILTKEQVKMVHENGIKVFSFTVNNRDEAHKILKWGVDGIFTDDTLILN